MSDPAVEAAWAACKAQPTPWTQSDVQDIAVEAAREALAPLRELHRKVDEWGEPVCAHCVGHDGWHLDWPCDTAKLIYPNGDL